MFGERSAHHLFFDTTELRFAVGGEEVGDTAAGPLFDRHVGVEHRDVERLGQPSPDRGLTRLLEADLGSGAWQRRHGDLDQLEQVDLGYRLLVADAR